MCLKSPSIIKKNFKNIMHVIRVHIIIFLMDSLNYINVKIKDRWHTLLID